MLGQTRTLSVRYSLNCVRMSENKMAKNMLYCRYSQTRCKAFRHDTINFVLCCVYLEMVVPSHNYTCTAHTITNLSVLLLNSATKLTLKLELQTMLLHEAFCNILNLLGCTVSS